ncbi:MAG: phosphotransferase [Spongiibacteraceae bacterium]
MSQLEIDRTHVDKNTMNTADQVVYDWLTQHFGCEPVGFFRQMRWRAAWEADVYIDGSIKTVLVRGSRGDGYIGPITMRQEAKIHDVLEKYGVPAPRVYGVIDEPLAIVMEKIPGGINSELAPSESIRQSLRRQFIEALAKLRQIPVEEFSEFGMSIPNNSDEAAINLYHRCIDIARKQLIDIGQPVAFVEFAARWLENNRPAGRDRIGFVTADSGQFMFDDDTLTGLIDFEVSYVGDPAAEFAGMRLRNTTEPLGNISALCDYYEELTGDLISKAAIEYHSAGFASTNSMLMWPLMFEPAPEHDLLAYMQFTIATSRWGLSGIAEFEGVKPQDPPEPLASNVTFTSAPMHLQRTLENFDTADENQRYQLDSSAALAMYLARCNRYGASILAADLEDASQLTGQSLKTREQAEAAVDAWVRKAGPEQNPVLIKYFHRWLYRKNFLLKGCGSQSYLTESILQPIASRPADQKS